MKFQSDPRDYALELVENGHDAVDLLTACLKYMSNDDVRDMLQCNELAPNTCEDCECECEDEVCEECQANRDIESYLEEHSEGYDIEAMRVDLDNGNLECGDDAEDYNHENIVQSSIDNGQFQQAKEQCKQFGLDYSDFL